MGTVIEQKETGTGLVLMMSNHLSQSQMPSNGLNLSEMPTDDLHPLDRDDNLNSGASSQGARAPSTTVSHWPLSDLHVAEAESQGHVAANLYKSL